MPNKCAKIIFSARFAASSKVYLFCHLQGRGVPVAAVCVFLRQKSLLLLQLSIRIFIRRGGQLESLDYFPFTPYTGVGYSLGLLAPTPSPSFLQIVGLVACPNTTIHSSLSALSLYHQCMHLPCNTSLSTCPTKKRKWIKSTLPSDQSYQMTQLLNKNQGAGWTWDLLLFCLFRRSVFENSHLL